jgi:hypothetical protein
MTRADVARMVEQIRAMQIELSMVHTRDAFDRDALADTRDKLQSAMVSIQGLTSKLSQFG